MSRLNVDKITGATGTASGAPITLSGDTATLADSVTGGTADVYFFATGRSAGVYQPNNSSFTTFDLDQVVDEGGCYASGVFTPPKAGVYVLGGIMLPYDMVPTTGFMIKILGAGNAVTREFENHCGQTDKQFQAVFNILYVATSSSDTYTFQAKLSVSDSGASVASNSVFYGYRI